MLLACSFFPLSPFSFFIFLLGAFGFLSAYNFVAITLANICIGSQKLATNLVDFFVVSVEMCCFVVICVALK